MARRMYSIDQINSEKPSDISFFGGNGINVEDNKVDNYVRISLSLHQHNITISSYDDSMKAYMTIFSINSNPMTTKENLLFYLQSGNMPATGTAENNTKLIYAIDETGQLLYTDMQGNAGVYSNDYNVVDTVRTIGG